LWPVKSDDWQKTAIELESRVGRLKREISDLREQLEVARLGQESIEAVELVGESGAGELGEGEVTVSPWCKTDGHKGQGEKRRRIE
jgi:hypothetical protein